MELKQEQVGNSWPKWLMAGDSAVILEFGNAVNPTINAQVHNWAKAVGDAQLTGLLEVVPTFRSLSIYFDPLVTDHQQVMAACDSIKVDSSGSPEATNTWNLPVCYDSDLGLDLIETATTLGISEETLIKKHSQSAFRVYVLGFMPGFSFLGGMDPDLNLPRRKTPRKLVPKGSVAIAMGLGGVYPFDSPGGWHVLGKTPTHMYDADRDPAIFFTPGDAVKFVPVSRAVFDRIDAAGGTRLNQLKGEVSFDEC